MIKFPVSNPADTPFQASGGIFFMPYLFFVLLNILCAAPSFGQSANAPFDLDYYHLLDRYEIKQKNFSPAFYSGFKPFSRQSIATFAEGLSADSVNRTDVDLFNIGYLLNDNWEWTDKADNDRRKPILKYFYKKNSDALFVKTKDFDFHLSPIAHFSLGVDPEFDGTTYTNTRGVRLRGSIGKKIGFFTSFTENQMRFAGYVQRQIDSTNAVPGERFWKVLAKSSRNIAQFRVTDAVDFSQVRGYVTFVPIGPVQLQIGHDRHKIGHGHRSLLLSGQTPDYFFLRINTKVWKFQYTNLYAQLNTRAPTVTNQLLPKKFMALHHLSINILPNLNVGLFESVMFGRDSIQNQFELEYLNPLIFYRTVELSLGDADNVNLGLDFRWNFLKNLQLYGQLLLDDFTFTEWRKKSGWHGNKIGTQIGLKYIDVARIPHLDLQIEYNSIRPYTYAHVRYPQGANHQHYGQALAHPLGANLREMLATLRYQALRRLQLTATFIAARQGEDAAPNQNNGGNIFLDYNKNRTSDYGHKTGQGTPSTLLFTDFTVSYQPFHNFFIDLKLLVRNKETPDKTLIFSNTVFPSLSLRWNTAQRRLEF